MKNCGICGKAFDELLANESVYAEAGAWLADEIWKDGGELCPECLENRARLVMMYHNELYH